MLSEQLLNELHHLNRTEKFRVVQMLVTELAESENLPTPELEDGTQYEIWSPFDAIDAAVTMQNMLDEYKHKHDQS